MAALFAYQRQGKERTPIRNTVKIFSKSLSYFVTLTHLWVGIAILECTSWLLCVLFGFHKVICKLKANQPKRKAQGKITFNIFLLAIPLWQPHGAISRSLWQTHISGTWTAYLVS